MTYMTDECKKGWSTENALFKLSLQIKTPSIIWRLVICFLRLEGGYINSHSLQQLCGPFTWVCVTPSLSVQEWLFSNAAQGLFEGQDRQKAERTSPPPFFFFYKPRHLSLSRALTSKSVVYRGPSSVDTLYRIFMAAQTNHYGAHSLLP